MNREYPARRVTFLALVVVVALTVRLGAVGVMRGFWSPPSPRHGADGIEFDALGARLAADGIYALPGKPPTSFRAPGLPIFLAALDKGFGHVPPPAYVAFAALGALSCLLTYFLALEVASPTCARRAAILAAVYPPHVLTATRFDSENLFIPIFAGSLWLLLRLVTSGGFREAAGSGFLLGAAALTRPFALLILPAWLLLVATRSGRRPARNALDAAVMTACFATIVAPWTARNLAVHGRPVLIATNGGSTFYGSNNDLVARWPLIGGWVSTGRLPGRDRIDATPDEASHDGLEWKLGADWVRDHPGLMPQLLAGKLARFWLPDVDSPNRPYRLLQLATYPPILALMIAGWWSLFRLPEYGGPRWLAVRATLATSVVTALIFWGSPRFRDANAPILMIYAAAGWVAISRRLGGDQRDQFGG